MSPNARRLWMAVGTVAVAIVAAAVLVPAALRAREEYRRVRNRDHLNRIAKALATYLEQYGGRRFYPPDLGVLVDTGCLADPGVLVSPFDRGPPRLPNGLPCSYEYTPENIRFLESAGERQPEDFPPNVPLVHERTPSRGGRVVLYADGHVEFRSALEEDLRSGREATEP